MAFDRHLSIGKGALYHPLLRGVLLSLVFHALILVPAVVLLAPSGGEKPLAARLASPAVAVAPKDAPRAEALPLRAATARPLPLPLPLPAAGTPANGASLAPAAAREQAPFKADEGLDPEALRDYRLALAHQSRLLRQGRTGAEGSGYQGRVEVRLRFGAGPSLVTVERSSGQTEVDGAALRLIGEAASAARLPESLRDKRFEILLPVIFGD